MIFESTTINYYGGATDRFEKAERTATRQYERTGVQRGKLDTRIVAIFENRPKEVPKLARSARECQGTTGRNGHDGTIDQINVRGRDVGRTRARDRVYWRGVLSKTTNRRRDTILQKTRQIPGPTDGKHPTDWFGKTKAAERDYRSTGDEVTSPTGEQIIILFCQLHTFF